VNEAPSRGWRVLGMGREFTRGDRAIYVATYVHIGVWFVIFVIGTIYNLAHGVDDAVWATFWRRYFYIQVAYTIFVIVWFTIGGFRDISAMLRKLRVMRRDEADDGMVVRDEREGR
jgi:SSS family solute:Na+ symporter